MLLSTGQVYAMNGKYGIDNLKVILRALSNIAKIIKKTSEQPRPPKGFFKKIKYWFVNIFTNRNELTQTMQDIQLISQNAELIKKEFMDLKGLEFTELLNYASDNLGVNNSAAFLAGVPHLIDAAQAFITAYKVNE